MGRRCRRLCGRGRGRGQTRAGRRGCRRWLAYAGRCGRDRRRAGRRRCGCGCRRWLACAGRRRRGKATHRVGHHQPRPQAGYAVVAAVEVMVGVVAAARAQQQAAVGHALFHPGPHGGRGVQWHPPVAHPRRQRDLVHDGAVEIAARRRPGRAGAGQRPGGAVGHVAGARPEVGAASLGPRAGQPLQGELHSVFRTPVEAVQLQAGAAHHDVRGKGREIPAQQAAAVLLAFAEEGLQMLRAAQIDVGLHVVGQDHVRRASVGVIGADAVLKDRCLLAR